jgi:4-hydroxybenzoate polyprenyltransferase
MPHAASSGRHDHLWISLVRLARPRQWFKSVFVLVGPLYGLSDAAATRDWRAIAPAAALAAGAFALVSSACYILNDIADAEKDRLHPRKKRRPIASGSVSRHQATLLASALFLVGFGLVGVLEWARPGSGWWTLISLLAYALNVVGYSLVAKHMIMADVISLAMGFVLRVLGGCAATGIPPSTWLLNVTFFLAMFLAFCKRLGERRVMNAQGSDAASVRGVQRAYTDELLRMSVVVTAVATLVTYAMYVQAHEAGHMLGFNLLWVTMLPATYGLLRAIVLVERGSFDDPTEMASGDRLIQAAVLVFGALAAGVIVWSRPS